MQYTYPTYARYDLEPVNGQGSVLIDKNGKKYLDFTSGIGVCNLGYQNPAIQQAVTAQLQKVWHISNLYENQLQDEVAHLLVGDSDQLVFFCNSGTEANEAALKLARKYTGKSQVLAFTNGFHGRTYGSLTMTDNAAIKTGFGPFVPDIGFAPYNDSAAIEQINDNLAAVILEVIQGEGGVVLGDKAWLQAVEAKCHETGVLLIIDEVQTGMGRTGSLFAFQQFDLQPDIVTMAKALANGIPVGAMMGKTEFASAFGPGAHGSTFGGNLLAMASAKAVLTQLTPEFLAEVKTKGIFIKQQLKAIDKLPNVLHSQSLGLMVGIELSPKVNADNIVRHLQQKGLLTLTAKHNTLRLLPPLVTTRSQLKQGMQLIEQTLTEDAYEPISK